MKITVGYFAALRERAGRSEESLETDAATPLELYQELQKRHNFTLLPRQLAVAINDQFQKFETLLKPGDYVVFIPPMAGG